MKEKMKQVIAITTITFLSVTANGQDYHNSAQTIFTNDPEFFIQSVLLVLSIYLILTFILTFIKLLLDYRIKTKIIEKGIPEDLITALLKYNNKDAKNIAIKWFFVFLSIGIGLTIIGLLQPNDIYSLTIIAFSIAAGFLEYYFFIRKENK